MSGERRCPTEQCPLWCVADHTEHVLPQDFVHEGALVTVPAVVLHRDREHGPPGQRQFLSATIDIVRYQYPGDVEEWVYIGSEGGPGLEISVESARRLALTVSQLVQSE